MSHDELNALCAEKVAGYTDIVQLGANPLSLSGTGRHGYRSFIPSYCADPAAVIALLEKEKGYTARYLAKEKTYIVYITVKRCDDDGEFKDVYGQAPTFAEAGVRALLKAHGCEVGE